MILSALVLSLLAMLPQAGEFDPRSGESLYSHFYLEDFYNVGLDLFPLVLDCRRIATLDAPEPTTPS